MATALTIEDLDIVFNGDKRGRQYFIINTDGLKTFDIDSLDPASSYGKIRSELGKDSEYQEVEENFFKNLKSGATDVYWNTYKTNFGTRGATTPPPPTKTDGFISVTQLDTFVTASELKANGLTTITGAITAPAKATKTSIDALDKIVARELKEAWKTYKIQSSSYKSEDIKKSIDKRSDIIAPTGPFDATSYTNKVLKSDDKYTMVKRDGSLHEFEEDKSQCNKYGFNSTDDCNEILYRCLVNPSADGLKACVTKIDSLMKRPGPGTGPGDLTLMNPELVLALLHRFGFKAIRNNGVKQIISADAWERNILKHLDLEATLVDTTGTTPKLRSTVTKTYLQNLVDYVNANPQILNPVDSNAFYDSKTKTDKFGKPVDIAKTNKIALQGLSRFYDARKNYAIHDTAGLMRDLYSRYDYNIPSFLQLGGFTPYETLKQQLDSGQAGATYLENVYKALSSSLSNVDITGNVAANANAAIGTLKAEEAKLLEYMKFADKVHHIYDMFKYSPTKVSLTGANIKTLETDLATKVSTYKKQEDQVAKFIQGLAKKEINPYTENSVFDI
jgi:hypothetical protein